jgi:hypothetical protein
LNHVSHTFNVYNCLYCDGFLESIARQQPSKHVPTHAPRNNTVEVFFMSAHGPLLYNACAVTSHNRVWKDHVTCVFFDSRCRHTTVAVTWRVSSDASSCHGYITRLSRITGSQLAVGDSHGKFVVEVDLWRLVCDWKIYPQRECHKSIARKRKVKTSGNRLMRLGSNEAESRKLRSLEYRLLQCSTETGELESENWVGIPRRMKKKLWEHLIVVWNDSHCVEIRYQSTTSGDWES